MNRDEIIRHERILNLNANRTVIIAHCQRAEEIFPPKMIVPVTDRNIIPNAIDSRAVVSSEFKTIQAFSQSFRAITIGSPPIKNKWLGSRFKPIMSPTARRSFKSVSTLKTIFIG